MHIPQRMHSVWLGVFVTSTSILQALAHFPPETHLFLSTFIWKRDKSKCVSCGKCAKACKMDVDVTKTPNHPECIRCGMCIRACPTNAVCFRYGFGNGKETTKKTTMEESK